MPNSRVKGWLVAAGTVLPVPAVAQPAPGPGGPWGYGMGWGWGWEHMIFGFGMMVLFWGGLILLVVLAVRWLGGSSSGRASRHVSRSALDILEERFARGEIDKQEFEERKRTLTE